MEEKYIRDLLFPCSNYLLKQVIWKCQNKLYIHGERKPRLSQLLPETTCGFLIYCCFSKPRCLGGMKLFLKVINNITTYFWCETVQLITKCLIYTIL